MSLTNDHVATSGNSKVLTVGAETSREAAESYSREF